MQGQVHWKDQAQEETVMQGMIEDQEVLVRGTSEYKSYLWYKLGWIKAIVNYAEEALSTTGRLMLLSYIVYIAVQAGMESIMHQSTPPLLDIIMLALQVAGLEGSIPGLIHTAEDLADRGKVESSRMVRGAANTAQWLAIATIGDLFLIAVNQQVAHAATIDQHLVTTVGIVTFVYSWGLLAARVYVIGKYLISMAHINRRDVRIISQSEVKSHPVQTLDLSQLTDGLRSEFGQQLFEIDAKIIQPEPIDYREIARNMMPIFSQFAASLHEEITAQICTDLKTEIVTQMSAQTVDQEPIDYSQIVSQMMPVLDQFKADLQDEISTQMTNLLDTNTTQIDMATLAQELAPLVRSLPDLETDHETQIVASDETDGETQKPRITAKLTDLPVQQTRNTDNLKLVSRSLRKSSAEASESATKMKRIVKRNPTIGPTELATKAGVSKSTASRFLKSQSA